MTLDRATREDFEIFFSRVQRWIRTRGLVWTADTIKLCRLSVTRYLTNNPLPRPSGIGLTRDGLPKVIRHNLRQIIRSGDPRGISLVLTLLSVTRGILGGKPVNLKPITEQSPNIDLAFAEPYYDKFINHYKLPKINTEWNAWHWSTTASPSGPAMVASLGSWEKLPDSLKSDLEILAGNKFKEQVIDKYSSWATATWVKLKEVFPCRSNDLFRKTIP